MKSIKKKFIILNSFFFLLMGNCYQLPALDRTPLDIATVRLLFPSLFGSSELRVGGEVRGLEGSGLRLELKVSESSSSVTSERLEQDITGNGNFSFNKSFTKDHSFAVQILSQPSNPIQVCEVGGASGIIGQNSASSILIQCGGIPQVAIPSFSPPPGEFSTETHVVISSTTANSTIYYTINGTDPDCSGGSGTLYSTPVVFTQPSLPNVTLKAIACSEDLTSSIQVGNYSVTNGQLDIPTVNVPPSGAHYATAQNVTLTPPGGATVHYTTDGSTPTCSSPSSPNPVNVATTQTIRAISCQADWTSSSVASFYYLITGTLAIVDFSHATGTYSNDFSLTLSVPNAGASIRYLLAVGADPGTPTCSSTLYTGPVTINTNDTRIRAIACLTDWDSSATYPLFSYTMQVAIPILNPAGGDVQTTTSVSATSITTGAIVHLGENVAPTCGSPTGLSLSPTGDSTENAITVNAIGCKPNYLNSSIQSSNFTTTGTILPLTFSLVSGGYTGTQNTTTIPGAVFPAGGFIRYTIDGSDPTCTTGNTYTLGDNISITGSSTIQAIACKTSPAWIPSNIASANYTITGLVANPSFSVGNGTFNETQAVTITSATPGAHIQYSLNSAITDCSQGTNLASGGTVNITATGTILYAIACKSGDADSGVVNAVYTLQPDTPTVNIGPDIYQTSQTINISSSAGTSIYYTTNGSDPNCTPSGTLGTSVTLNPFQGAVTVKAIACRANFEPSGLFTGVYQMNGQVTAPTWTYSNDATNTMSGTLNSPPVVGSQKLCWRVDTDPQCSLNNGDVADSMGGECAGGSTAYVNPFAVTSPGGSYRAIACSANYLSSAVQTVPVTIAGSVGLVSINPGTSIVNNDPSVTMSATNATAIYYRTDGANPDCSGTDGSTPYPVGGFTQSPTSVGTVQLKAIGCASGYAPSAMVISATYTYTVGTPTFPLASDTYYTSQSFTITPVTTGATYYYRVDGTNATCGVSAGNFEYTGAITLPTNPNFLNLHGVIDQLRIVGCKTDYNSLNVLAPSYTFSVGNFTASIGNQIYLDEPTNSKTDTIGPSSFLFGNLNPSGTVYCYRSDGIEPRCAKTAEGTAVDSGDFCAIDSSSASLNVLTAANTGNFMIRGCKDGFKHTVSKQLNLTVQEFRPRIFVSNSTTNGATSVTAADALCNVDANRPFKKPEASYAAFRLGGSRTLTNNWVLEGDTNYYNLANQLVGLTPSEADSFNTNSPFALTNPIDPLGTLNVYTGMNINGATQRLMAGGNLCDNWTSNSDLITGGIGNSSLTNSQFVSTTQAYCNNLRRLYCVEQNPRKRIFVTATLYAGGNMGGKAGADNKCNDPADTNKPSTGEYKALVRTSTRFRPSTDWVLKPETSYYRTDRSTLIGTTNTQSIFANDFTNPISASPGMAWIGYGNDWQASSTNCMDYNSYEYSGSADVNETAMENGFLKSPTSWINCTNLQHLICVEQ